MLLAGFVLSNSYPDVQNINKTTKSIMSDLAFSIILVRAGLSLNIETFKQMKATIFLLAMTPGNTLWFWMHLIFSLQISKNA